jgi:hypothetical protein
LSTTLTGRLDFTAGEVRVTPVMLRGHYELGI